MIQPINVLAIVHLRSISMVRADWFETRDGICVKAIEETVRSRCFRSFPCGRSEPLLSVCPLEFASLPSISSAAIGGIKFSCNQRFCSSWLVTCFCIMKCLLQCFILNSFGFSIFVFLLGAPHTLNLLKSLSNLSSSCTLLCPFLMQAPDLIELLVSSLDVDSAKAVFVSTSLHIFPCVDFSSFQLKKSHLLFLHTWNFLGSVKISSAGSVDSSSSSAGTKMVTGSSLHLHFASSQRARRLASVMSHLKKLQPDAAFLAEQMWYLLPWYLSRDSPPSNFVCSEIPISVNPPGLQEQMDSLGTATAGQYRMSFITAPCILSRYFLNHCNCFIASLILVSTFWELAAFVSAWRTCCEFRNWMNTWSISRRSWRMSSWWVPFSEEPSSKVFRIASCKK